MNKIILCIVVAISLMLGIRNVLQSGKLLQFLDEHPDPRWVPTTEYYIGDSFYIFHNLQEAATYYIRIPERYPESSLSDDAYWAYLQTLEDDSATSRATLIEVYGQYLERFPKGAHAENAQNKIDTYKSGAR